jgi:CheY-like chemotaxis protein
VLLDVMMPGMSGGEVALAIREGLNLPALPIIFLTAAVDGRATGGHRGLAAGNAFMAKPCDLDQLVGLIERFLPK